MLGLIPVFTLLLSGVCGGLFRAFNFRAFNIAKIGAVVSSIFFISNIFRKEDICRISWFSIRRLDFSLSFEFSETGLVICSAVSLILCCLYFANESLRFASFASIDKTKFDGKQTNEKFWILNVFAFFMCLAVLSTNLFQFYMAVEGMGIISTFLVGFEKNSIKQSSRVFIFNKFASLSFLIAIALIAGKAGGFECSEIKAACLTEGSAELFWPTILLLISVLCKGAQMPFSYWLIDAVKANVFASILIHAGTIVGVGVIFVSKYYFLFERFPVLQNVMLNVGLFTMVWMACRSIFQNNVKRIIACLTASSTGIMFALCGTGACSSALLYFLCHAFFKSTIFLSFAYLILGSRGEQDILKIGETGAFRTFGDFAAFEASEAFPLKIRVVVWLSFLAAVGFPFLPGSFAKVAFADAMQTYNMPFALITDAAASVLGAAALFRVLFLSFYNRRVSSTMNLPMRNQISFNVKPVWLLFSVSAVYAFAVSKVYELGGLHFGYGGNVTVNDSFNFLVESVKELAYVGVAILFVWIFENNSILKKLSNKRFSKKVLKILVEVFREDKIYEFLCNGIKSSVLFAMHCFDKTSRRFTQLMNRRFFRALYSIDGIVSALQKSLLSSHVAWVISGIVLALVAVGIARLGVN
ncbi:MAG: hypothetical protein LBM19_00410 [Holosporales bacterium]|jgi:NADH:ubiquinone oxidoreductase subunit 5 (subunit L)/multisubunit Na+/H+ antiporter MnhA subunit|nr:hypothetical protein [Holosporales bacterium]